MTAHEANETTRKVNMTTSKLHSAPEKLNRIAMIAMTGDDDDGADDERGD